MNTGAEDDSLSTPILAFSKSSAFAAPFATSNSNPASASRANPVIQFPPTMRLHQLRVARPLRRAFFRERSEAFGSLPGLALCRMHFDEARIGGIIDGHAAE